MNQFNKFALKNSTLECIDNVNFVKPTNIQDLVIPLALENKSLIAKGKTGSGKTHAFLIPIADKINPNIDVLQTLILVPTRELAVQLNKVVKDFLKPLNTIKVTTLVGGEDEIKQKNKLQKTPHILIGTPNKIKQLVIDNGLLNLNTVSTLIIDEADMCVDLGFLNEVDKIASLTKANRQILVFSATIPVSIKNFLKKYIKNSILIEDEKGTNNENIEHILYPTRSKKKEAVLLNIINNISPYVCLIFANSKDEVEKYYNFLLDNNIDVEIIHGGLEARKRKRNIKNSLAGRHKFIVASDIASRGIDIPGVSHVISISFPKNNPEFYIHRAGRCGRNNLTGQCISIYNEQDKMVIEKLSQMGVSFSRRELVDGKWKELKDINARKKREKKTTQLDLDIQKIVKTNKNKKVKPNYKKKTQLEIQRLKKKHKRAIIQQDIKKRIVKRAIERSKQGGEQDA